MTNREWLNTLTDEQLVMFWTFESSTFFVGNELEDTAYCIGRQWTSSKSRLVEWLGEERK